MYRRASVLALVVLLGPLVAAQVQMRPTPAPLVTAENEAWYLNGEPVVHAGQFYYPAGAQVFFNGNEMVRSGFHLGVPLFSRTTLEPYSVVYVPIGRGLMQPYERLRSGDLAGTVGSRTPSFPVAIAPSEASGFPQAAAPPMGGAVVPSTPEPVGTTGTGAQWQPRHVRIGGRPTGLNAVYIDYQGTRWYSTGGFIEVRPDRMTKIGDYHGFPVWRAEGSDDIYMSTSPAGTLAVLYSRERRPLGGAEERGRPDRIR
jgi:hypothetical protein